jgi:hypothetical protein
VPVPCAIASPRRFQRRNVVDAVTDHRDVPPAVRQRLHDTSLVLGRDPADRRALLDQSA